MKQITAWMDSQGAIYSTRKYALVGELMVELKEEFQWLQPESVSYHWETDAKVRALLEYLAERRLLSLESIDPVDTE